MTKADFNRIFHMVFRSFDLFRVIIMKIFLANHRMTLTKPENVMKPGFGDHW